ncbi:Palmitoyltransferase pfa4 [Fonsecaea pedrosoi]|nr:Palmitoyltransferase pfa4 [Fonsecaea pedrosoi]
MDPQQLARFAVPAVVTLVAFLSYSSQYLFYSLEPGPLRSWDKIVFNMLVIGIWICYTRACMTNPGRVPAGWKPDDDEETEVAPYGNRPASRHRFCRKCEAIKPPRSHHCRVCKRCIPKMDHHCPWTVNCVSHFTLPHFMRFLWYAVSAMVYLEYLLFVRAGVVWENRNLPSLVHLLILIIVNTLTLFLVSVTFLRTVWGLGANVTTIESWEIERHEQLLRRARALGGYLDGPDGIRVKIVKQEFPYDIGIWNNIVQGMGTANFLAWFWPFSATPTSSGLVFETNGFEDPGTTWPPPDPDRMPRLERPLESVHSAFVHDHNEFSPNDEMEAFKRRQQADFELRPDYYGVQRRKPFHDRFEEENLEPVEDDYIDLDDDESLSGEEGWQDSGGNRLKDYGVDEDVEFYDEDSVPIAELLSRRREGRQGQT